MSDSRRLTAIESKLGTISEALVRLAAIQESIPARVTDLERKVLVYESRVEGGAWVIFKALAVFSVIVSGLGWLADKLGLLPDMR